MYWLCPSIFEGLSIQYCIPQPIPMFDTQIHPDFEALKMPVVDFWYNKSLECEEGKNNVKREYFKL